MIYIMYAKTNEELSTSCLGMYHDHSKELYYGKIENLPIKYEKYKKQVNTNIGKYIAIFEEDEPSYNIKN